MADSHIVLAATTLICLTLGLAAVAIAAYGNAWYVLETINEKYQVGLWQECKEIPIEHCIDRKDIFEFDKTRVSDVILTLLIASGAFSLLGMISNLFMFCFKNPELWRCCAGIMTLITFAGASCAFGAVIHNEWRRRDAYKVLDHGWSVILAWVGAMIQLLGAIFSSNMICNAPPQVDIESRSVIIVRPKGYEMM